MDLQNLHSSVDIRSVEHYTSVETAGSKQGRVKDVWTVSGGEHNYAGISIKAVHLSENLIEGLLPFIMASTKAGATMAAHSIYFIDEYDTWRMVLGLVKKVTYTGCPNAYKH